jgi:hypothetical protein
VSLGDKKTSCTGHLLEQPLFWTCTIMGDEDSYNFERERERMEDQEEESEAEIESNARGIVQSGRGRTPPPYPTGYFPLAQPSQFSQMSQTQLTQGTVATLHPSQMSQWAQSQLSQNMPASSQGRASRGRGGRATGGRKTGSVGYKQDELLFLLDIMESRLPVGPDQWELVLTKHNETYAAHNRSVSSLKRAYQNLLRKTMPTGDPDCPPKVRKAKQIE